MPILDTRHAGMSLGQSETDKFWGYFEPDAKVHGTEEVRKLELEYMHENITLCRCVKLLGKLFGLRAYVGF